MDAIVQCRGMFYKFGYSGKDYVERLYLKKKIEKDVKNVKELEKIIKVFILLLLFGPFHLI